MNSFDIKAKEMERRFFRKINKGTYFLTGGGKQNDIVDFSNKTVSIRSKKNKSSFSISREKLKSALSFLLKKKTATHKELEKFANFNSALMGLLRLILIDIAKISKNALGLMRITIKGVRFFFSGLDKPTNQDFEAITRNGAMFVLNTYYWLREKGTKLDEWMQKLEKNNIKLLVDSGAFSLFNAQKKGSRWLVKMSMKK
ncbi:hypothetical protein RYX45_06425 [Alkalihalophilus pseudofirmus]|uniref:Uncharacterized protein n=1 Tax=Alkalihalophilus pseudofirmus TaxID=79885 RepID=A0AAJ2KXC1_ALKPS|nr:hypothetical protein [Alkalihalophilus pseudofirmus]MDV2884806.1 hypothetical protein [Alkalihalophilus pseudofirmus]